MSKSNSVHRKFQVAATAVAFSLICGVIFAQAPKTTTASKPAPKMAMASHPIVTPDSLKWAPLFPGVDAIQMAVVSGDPSKPGPFVVRLKIAKGAVLAAHWHPTTENVTVLQGTFSAGMGDKFDETKLTKMQPGDFISIPARAHHFARAETDVIVQDHAPGPFAMTFVNSADDPRIKH
jgi:quercetin dioxygenase-like cupin family protein